MDRDIKRKIKKYGWQLEREGTNHQIWIQPTFGWRTYLPRDSNLNNGLKQKILNDLEEGQISSQQEIPMTKEVPETPFEYQAIRSLQDLTKVDSSHISKSARGVATTPPGGFVFERREVTDEDLERLGLDRNTKFLWRVRKTEKTLATWKELLSSRTVELEAQEEVEGDSEAQSEPTKDEVEKAFTRTREQLQMELEDQKSLLEAARSNIDRLNTKVEGLRSEIHQLNAGAEGHRKEKCRLLSQIQGLETQVESLDTLVETGSTSVGDSVGDSEEVQKMVRFLEDLANGDVDLSSEEIWKFLYERAKA